MPIPQIFAGKLNIPVICAPMFVVSGPELVIAQCKSGMVGSFPALNARRPEELDLWLTRIKEELERARRANPAARIAPYAVNHIVHGSNTRLKADLAVCAKHQTPMIITSLQAPHPAVEAAHNYGGIVFHDVINAKHARKAIEAGVDGLILVAAGAGGHAGALNPLALVAEIRQFYEGPIALSGAITSGAQVLAAQAMGADFAYIGTRFLATPEANADPEYKQMLIESTASDIIFTDLFSGVKANYLRGSILRSGLDPDRLPIRDKDAPQLETESEDAKPKAWRDIWGAGQGVGSITDIVPVSILAERMSAEYRAAYDKLGKNVSSFA